MSAATIAALAIALVVAFAWRGSSRVGDVTPRPRDATVSVARSGDSLRSTNSEAQTAHALPVLVAESLRAWEADDDPDLRDERTREVERLLARGGATIAGRLAIIETLPPRLMDFAFGLPSFQRWMFSEPAAALDWMSRHPEISDARILTLFQDWSEKDPDSLRRYLAALPDGAWKQRVMMAASYEALPHDPVEAISRARQMNAGGAQTGLLEIATTSWTQRDPAAAARWVSEVREPSLREQLIGSFTVGCADTAPDLAATYAIESLPPGKILDRTLAEIARAWAEQDPANAAAWIEQFPDSETRHAAVGNLLNAWMARDRAAAIAWIRGLSDVAMRNQAGEFIDADAMKSVAASP